MTDQPAIAHPGLGLRRREWDSARRGPSLMHLAIAASVTVGILLCCAVASIIVLNARQAIYEETSSAFDSALATISLRMPRRFAGEDTMGDAIRLSSEVDALRHVAAQVIDPMGGPITVRAHDARSPEAHQVPDWFTRLMAPERISNEFAVSHYPNVLGHLVVETDPSDEIAEVWGDFGTILPLLALTGLVMIGLTLFVIRILVGRLDALQSAVSAIRRGDTARRAPKTNLREFVALAEGINDLAAHLRNERLANSRLQRRILRLSEDERAKIAFDLHDEMGPLLFALNLALAQAKGEVQHLQGQDTDQLTEAIAASAEHARAVQDRARAAINDLRPMLVGHAPLCDVLGELVSEFASIAPKVFVSLNTDELHSVCIGELAEISIYRFVRESVLNAIRHGHADQIEVSLQHENFPDCELIARISDNGRGPVSEPVAHGYGLAGINDRALALGAAFLPPYREGKRTVTELRMPCQ